MPSRIGRPAAASLLRVRACTIIAKNYVAQARVLARSFLRHHPGGEFSVLIIDEFDGFIDPASEPFTVITPSEIGCEAFERMAARYDVLELSTAVKPWLLRHQLDAEASPITYLDPDVEVFGSLEALDERARRHGLVLIPHNTEPIPSDEARPREIDILIAGVYNLGFVSVSQRPEIDSLIDWWSERLQRDCRVDPVYGYFVDQRWFDLAPGFVSDCSIVRDPEYNVAYWNVHSRQLSWAEDRYTVNGRPLAFFHFSGFDPGFPDVLSRHQTRIELASQPPLGQICGQYAQATKAEGYEEARKWPYTFGCVADGTPFTRLLRLLYARWEDQGRSQSPFEAAGCQALLEWAGAQQEGAPIGINRALAAVYGARPDVNAAFPDLNGADRNRFLQWAAASSGELGLPLRLLTDSRANGGPAARPAVEPAGPELAWGVNVVGYFRSELGVGEAARQVVSALDAHRVPLLPVHGRTIPLNRQEHHFEYLDCTDAGYPINLICMNADALPEFVREAGPAFFRDRYSIGLWFWEVTTPPSAGWAESFDVLDEVWVPTRHVAEAVAAVSPVPVVKVTLPIRLPSTGAVDRATLGLSNGFMFLFSFDYLSVFERKNPLAVIDAFQRGFAPGSGATLVLKCINREHDPINHQRLVEAVAEHPDISLLDSYLPAWQKNGLMASCDCYVSLHRAEGYGLTMAEAMYLGKPVIATGYSGNLDFMSSSTGYLVDYDPVPIGPGAEPYPPQGIWADPDSAHAARLMHEVFEDPGRANERGRHGAQELRRTHSPEAAGEQMLGRLDWIRMRMAARPPTHAVIPTLRPRLQRGPLEPPSSRLGVLGPPSRSVALRLMRPYTAYQRTVDDELLRSLEAIDQRVARIGEAQNRFEAHQLAQARGLEAQVDELSPKVDALRALHDPVVARLDDMSRRLERLEVQEPTIPHMNGEPFKRSHHPVAGMVEGYRLPNHHPSADPYRSFEDIFRGSEEFIRDRQRRFIELIGDRTPVLDYGCGRGEFLDLLRELGTAYQGVDSDSGMVARCQAKGHERVALAEGNDYLESLEPGSIGAIFCAQVIEHLPYQHLMRFLELARRALKPDGLLIAETVNPHSPPALKTFWVDLTHQHPVFPEVALALCQAAGFSEAFVFYPNGTGDVDRDRPLAGEYAVVAVPGAQALRLESVVQAPM